MGDNGKKDWMEYLRIVTPVMLFLIGLVVYGMKDDIREIKGQMLVHLTNSEMHVPRATVVSRDEFTIYQSMRDRQMADVKDSLCRIENFISKHIGNDRR
jgi:hypothetical protein